MAAPQHVVSAEGTGTREVLGRLASARGLVPVAVALAVFLLGTGVLAWARHDPPLLKIDATFSKDACCAWQVWVNDASDAGNLTILPMQWGTRTTYTAPVYHGHVDHLLIPVGTQPGGSVVIRGISLTRGDGVVGRVGLDQLHAATTYHATKRNLADGIEVRGTDVYPAIDLTGVSLDAHESAFRMLLVRAVTQRLASFVALLVLAALLMTLVATHGRGGLGLPLSIVSTLGAVRLLPWVSRQFDFRDDVSNAVGYASYVGIWKARERFVVDTAAVAAVVIPAVLALAVLRRRRGVAAAEEEHVEGAGRPPRWLLPVLVAFPVVAAALAGMPNLRQLIGPPSQFVPSWDGNNFVFWEYLVQKTNLHPVEDFFWPYGFQWLFDEPAPWGQVVSYLWFLSFWAFLAVGAYLALSRFIAGWRLVRRYVLVAGFLLTALLTADAPFTTRYVGPLGLVLLYVGISPDDRLRSPKRLLFAVAALGLTLFEVAQTLYALVPIGFLLLVELVAAARRTRVGVRSYALRAAATVAVPLAAAAAVLAADHTLDETANFYRQELVAASAYAFPSAVDEWVGKPGTLESLVFWAVPVTIALGIFGLVARRGRERVSSAAVAALGLLGLMMMQKQILRPHSATQIWLPVIFGLVFWAMTDGSLHRGRRALGVGATAGMLAALVLVSGGYRTGWNSLNAAPKRLSDSIGALLHQREEFTAQEKLAFGADTFARFSDYQPVVRALRSAPSVRQSAPVWVLGDDTAIPMMLGESWPYYFNDLYDTSPLAFQKMVLDRLERRPPSRVVWNFSPAALVFDAVPSPVRVPLLYTWAVRSLVPDSEIGHFAILRPRREGEEIALRWWRDRLGSTLNLGHIPEAATTSGRSCESGPTCGTQLLIRFPAGTPHPPQIDVPVTVGGVHFTIALQTSEASRYVVPLDRVWFWAARPDVPRSIDALSVGGAVVTVLRRTIDPNVLY